MTRILQPGALQGCVEAPSSKSEAHRLLICAALADAPSAVSVKNLSGDLLATVRCLRALGADLQTEPERVLVSPVHRISDRICDLDCGESGTTLRFLLPIVGAFGVSAVFHMHGRLPQRPLSPLDDILRQHGLQLRKNGSLLSVSGQLLPGFYSIPGDISSQYISGLLLALPLLNGDSTLEITGKTESAPYIHMTENALSGCGIRFQKEQNIYHIPGRQVCHAADAAARGDYSAAAFFLCAGALSDSGVTVTGLAPDSLQADRAVLELLQAFGADVTVNGDRVTVRKRALHSITVDAAQIPDLIPALSVVAAAAQGATRIKNASRLRLKESDRLHAIAEMLQNLGGEVSELADGLEICGGKPLSGGRVDAYGDHRIAMAAAIASPLCGGDIVIDGAESVTKSYPRFWEDYFSLKGEST